MMILTDSLLYFMQQIKFYALIGQTGLINLFLLYFISILTPTPIYIDGLVNGGDLVFTIPWTYMSSKSGLSAQKSESNLGDATLSLRMVN